MSFFNVAGLSDSVTTWTFAGFGNYKTIFHDRMFQQSMKNICKIWLYGGLGVMLISLVFAVGLTSGMKGFKFFRSVIYLPNVISAVAMATMWIYYVYNSDYGFFHKFLAFFGFTKASQILWTGPAHLFSSMLVAYCFGMVGYHMLIFISGIEQIPVSYHEAAKIEGANVVQRFFYITLPFLKGTVRTNIVMWTIFTVGYFVWGQMFSPDNLSNQTVAPMNYMYELVFGASSPARTVRNSGAGAAIGIVMMVMVLIAFGLTNLLVRKDDIEL